MRVRGKKYQAEIKHNGELHFLGFFHIPEEAALCVARWLSDHFPADQIGMKAATAAAPPPHLMTAAEADTAAAAEILALECANNASEFRFVRASRKKYQAEIKHSSQFYFLILFHTLEEVALCVARWRRDHVPADQIALEAAAAAAPPPNPMTVAESDAAAATEGLALERANNSSGFRLVSYHKQHEKHGARFKHNGKQLRLGSFPTPKEVALCVGRWRRHHVPADQIALEAAAAAAPPPYPMTATEAVAVAAAEGLALDHNNNASGFRFVWACGN